MYGTDSDDSKKRDIHIFGFIKLKKEHFSRGFIKPRQKCFYNMKLDKNNTNCMNVLCENL